MDEVVKTDGVASGNGKKHTLRGPKPRTNIRAFKRNKPMRK